MPNVRCMWYEESGAPIQDGCRRRKICEFVHPSDASWHSAAPSRNKPFQNSGGGPHPRAGGRKHSESDTANESSNGGWNQFAAASAGNPVDAGWGGTKRKASGTGWGADTAPSSQNTGWGDTGASSSNDGGWGAGWGTPGTSDATTAQFDATSAWGAAGWGAAEPTSKKAGASTGWSSGGWGESTWGNNGGTSGGEVSKSTTKTAGGWGQWTEADANSSADKDKRDASGSGSKDLDGWGNSSWGAPMDNGNGGWGTAAEGTSGRTSKVTVFSKPANSNPWGAAPSAPKESSAWAPSSRATNGGREVQPAVNRDKSAWDTGETPTASTSRAHASIGKRDAVRSVELPFEASTAMLIGEDDWPMTVDDDATALKTRAHARAPSRTPSVSHSRASSPCDSASTSSIPSHMDYVKALVRAIRVYQEVEAAKDERAHSKRLEGSQYYQSVGERGKQILKKVKKESDHKMRSATRRWEEATKRLNSFPPTTHAPPSTVMTEEMEDLQVYVKEVSTWIDEVRPVIERMRAARLKEDISMQDDSRTTLPIPSTSAPHAADGDKFASLLLASAEKLEERISGLESYHSDLQKDQLSFVQQKIDEVLVFKRSKPDRIPPPEAETLHARFETQRQIIRDLGADNLEIKQEVENLKWHQPEQVLELQRLRVENCELKQHLSKVEEKIEETIAMSSERYDEMRRAQGLLEAIVDAKAAPPPPIIDPEIVGEHLKPFVIDSIREDLTRAISEMRGDMEQSSINQQEEFCNLVWGELQTTLRIANAIFDTAEKGRISAQILGADPPLLAEMN